MENELKTTEGLNPDVTDEGQEGQVATEVKGQKEVTDKEGNVISDPNTKVTYLGKVMTLAEAEKIYKGLQKKHEKERSDWTSESESLKGAKQLDDLLRKNPEKARKIKEILEAKAEEKTGKKRRWLELSDQEQVETLESWLESRDTLKTLSEEVQAIKTLIQNAGTKAKRTEEEKQLEADINENVKRLGLDKPNMKDELNLFWDVLASMDVKEDDDISEICDRVMAKISTFSKNKIKQYIDGKKGKDDGLESGDGTTIVKKDKKTPFNKEEWDRKIEEKFKTIGSSEEE